MVYEIHRPDTPIRGGVSGVKRIGGDHCRTVLFFRRRCEFPRFRRRGVAFLSEIYPCSFRFLLEKGPIRHILYRQRILSGADGRLLWIKRESDPSYMENRASSRPASRGGRPARPGGPGAGFPVKSSELTDKRGCRPWNKMV